jgi:formylglycine-generating enzyme required for sulfatase activity
MVTMPVPYWMGETEVTYELWYTVRAWAVSNGYALAVNAGREGHDGVIGAAPTTARKEPVTSVSFNDIVVWCNALTEWYNAKTGSTLTQVYQSGGQVIKDAANTTALGSVTAAPGATGFRLPSSDEWELAARWQGTTPYPLANTNKLDIGGVYYFTPGTSASGAKDLTTGLVSETTAVAYYAANSGAATQAVKRLAANALGLYDMSGNVQEFTFEKDILPWWTLSRGGAYNTAAGATMQYLQVGYYVSTARDTYAAPTVVAISRGFRLAQNAR